MFKINQTYGYEDGFYFGTPDDNRLLGLDVDLFENYYLGFERYWQHTNTSAWMYRLPWHGGWEYDIIWGKVSSESQSLQWVTNVATDNIRGPVPDPLFGNTPKMEFLYNRDHMYSTTVSPYGGLVLVVA